MIKKATINYFKNLFIRITRDDFLGMASEMAYMLALGLFPFMTFLVAVFGWLGKKSLVARLLDFFRNIVPGDVINLIEEVLREVVLSDKGGLLAISGFVVAIFLASNAIFVIIKGLNRAYGVDEHRSFVLTRALAILMVFANALVTFLSMNLIIFGKVILNYVLLYTNMPFHWVALIAVVRWPLAFAALFFMAALNYYMLPAVEGPEYIKRKSTLFGSLFFCVFWILGSSTFSIYVNNLKTYNKVYGAIGAFAILMVWLFYTSLIILIGGEINSQAYRRLAARAEEKESK